MENAIVSLLCIALLLIGTLNLGITSISVAESIADSSRQAQQERSDIMQTRIAITNATVSNDCPQITVRNEGAVSLANFSRWDVIVHYQGGATIWLPCPEPSIYFQGEPEVFEPGILNPSEEMVLTLSDVSVPPGSAAEVTISTPRGVRASVIVANEEGAP